MPSPELRERLAELDDLGRAGYIADWDQQTMMPPGGNDARGNVLATLHRLTHDRMIDPALGALLDEAQRAQSEDPDFIRVVRRDHEVARRVPSSLTSDIALAAAEAQPIWIKARAGNDFAAFVPALERNL